MLLAQYHHNLSISYYLQENEVFVREHDPERPTPERLGVTAPHRPSRSISARKRSCRFATGP